MKRSGTCRNPGCERLATVQTVIFGLGDRDLCYFCWQALSSMGIGIRRVEQPKAKPLGGAA